MCEDAVSELAIFITYGTFNVQQEKIKLVQHTALKLKPCCNRKPTRRDLERIRENSEKNSNVIVEYDA